MWRPHDIEVVSWFVTTVLHARPFRSYIRLPALRHRLLAYLITNHSIFPGRNKHIDKNKKNSDDGVFRQDTDGQDAGIKTRKTQRLLQEHRPLGRTAQGFIDLGALVRQRHCGRRVEVARQAQFEKPSVFRRLRWTFHELLLEGRVSLGLRVRSKSTPSGRVHGHVRSCWHGEKCFWNYVGTAIVGGISLMQTELSVSTSPWSGWAGFVAMPASWAP